MGENILKPKEFLPGVPDWSTVHQPTGALFSPIKDKSEWGKFKLSADLVEQFWRDGYISDVPILTPEQCEVLAEDYQYFMGECSHPGKEMLYEYASNQAGDPNNVLMHALGHWRLTQAFHDLVFMPRVVVAASQLLSQGKEVPVRFWHDQMFAKPAQHGGVVAWHQDYSYWTRTKPMNHLTVHIALDEQTAQNGTLHYIPSSHRWTRNVGAPLPVTDFNFKDMESIKTILNEEELAEFKPVPTFLKKGTASFHHPLSVHGSYGNRSNVPRRALVLNYFQDGVCSDTDGELLKDSLIPKGQPMGGQLYPIVFDPSWAV